MFHHAALGDHHAQALVHLGLERLERNLFAIDANVPVFLVLGYDAESRDFAVRDERVVKEGVVANG